MSLQLQQGAKEFKYIKQEVPNNSKDFLIWTKGSGIKCMLCNSKIFFNFSNWKNHTKTKKHLSFKNTHTEEKEDIEALKKEVKLQKAMVCKYCNMYEASQLKLKDMKKKEQTYLKELNKLKKDIKAKFNI